MKDGDQADLASARRLELGLIGLRWFVVGFGVLLTAASIGTGKTQPDYVLPLGSLLVASLALGNVIVSTLTEGAATVRQLRLVGLAAFVLDLVVVTALVWTYATPGNSLWVLAYVLPLEGALRYRFVGAMVPVALNLVSEPLRELAVTVRYPLHPYLVSAVAFRLGVEMAVAVVAGLMARSLRREADLARERAIVAEDLARREADARRETSAFHTAILAGVTADGVGAGVRSMAASIARDLGLPSLGILLVEGDEVVAVGVHGTPGYPAGAHLAIGAGSLVGRVAIERRTGVETPIAGSAPYEAAVPLAVGSDLVGVLHVRTADPVSGEELRMLAALSDQVAMVIQSALLRERQDETVRRLRELDEMKSDFVAITSHELRTPLAAIRGFVKTLQRRMDELSSEETQEFLGIVEQQTDRLIRLVEDLLVVSRIEAGKLSLEPEALEPEAFLHRVVAGLGDEGRIEVCIGPGLPALFVADPGRLGQVLVNLLQNALKFSPPDRRVVLRADVEGGDLALRVADEGVGIPPDELERIFERFHQTDSAATRKAEGAGLGLYITRKLAEAMGGRIEVVSEVGVGSTFTTLLPLGPVEGRARPSAAARAD